MLTELNYLMRGVTAQWTAIRHNSIKEEPTSGFISQTGEKEGGTLRLAMHKMYKSFYK